MNYCHNAIAHAVVTLNISQKNFLFHIFFYIYFCFSLQAAEAADLMKRLKLFQWVKDGARVASVAHSSFYFAIPRERKVSRYRLVVAIARVELSPRCFLSVTFRNATFCDLPNCNRIVDRPVLHKFSFWENNPFL